MSIPTVKFFKGGAVAETLVGLRGLPEYKAALEKYL
jgi:hypothetical protein